jgi:hypothetical protein
MQPAYGQLSAAIVTQFLDRHLRTTGGIAAKS